MSAFWWDPVGTEAGPTGKGRDRASGRPFVPASSQPPPATRHEPKRYWLNTREKDPVVFRERVEAVCDTYREAPALARDQGTHTISTDEMTGLQALERSAPTLPMTYGRPERIESEYTRHGTLALIGNFSVTTGELIAPTIGPTRTELDFVEHIARTVATDPEAGWIFVVDNLNIHGSEMLVRFVAQACGIEEPLGRKGCAGSSSRWPAGKRSCRRRVIGSGSCTRRSTARG